MKTLCTALVIVVLSVSFFGLSFAAPKKARVPPWPRQGGLYMWSTAAKQFVQIDRVLNGVQWGNNALFLRVTALERRVAELEEK